MGNIPDRQQRHENHNKTQSATEFHNSRPGRVYEHRYSTKGRNQVWNASQTLRSNRPPPTHQPGPRTRPRGHTRKQPHPHQSTPEQGTPRKRTPSRTHQPDMQTSGRYRLSQKLPTQPEGRHHQHRSIPYRTTDRTTTASTNEGYETETRRSRRRELPPTTNQISRGLLAQQQKSIPEIRGRNRSQINPRHHHIQET